MAEGERPVVTIDPAVCVGLPQINGTTTGGMWWDYAEGGFTVADIMRRYKVTREQVLVAVWYEAQLRPLLPVWQEWCTTVFAAARRDDWPAVPDPPRSEPRE
jgi:uncharacterized protein (DUF433 family)